MVFMRCLAGHGLSDGHVTISYGCPHKSELPNLSGALVALRPNRDSARTKLRSLGIEC